MRWNCTPRDLWTDPAMSSLEAVPLTISTLWLYLRTCDRPTRIAGLLRGPGSIADDTGWPVEQVRRHVAELARRGLIIVSERPAYILVPAALAFDRPTPGHDTAGALAELRDLPECAPIQAARHLIEHGDLGPWTPRVQGEAVEAVEAVEAEPVEESEDTSEPDGDDGSEDADDAEESGEPKQASLLGGASPRPRKADERKAAAARLCARWAELSGHAGEARGKAWDGRVARFLRFLGDWSEADLEADLEALAADDWWRGRTGEPAIDLFRRGPEKFLNDAGKVEARILRRRTERPRLVDARPEPRSEPRPAPPTEPVSIDDAACRRLWGYGLETARWARGAAPEERPAKGCPEQLVARCHSLLRAHRGDRKAQIEAFGRVLDHEGAPRPPSVEALAELVAVEAQRAGAA